MTAEPQAFNPLIKTKYIILDMNGLKISPKDIKQAACKTEFICYTCQTTDWLKKSSVDLFSHIVVSCWLNLWYGLHSVQVYVTLCNNEMSLL